MSARATIETPFCRTWAEACQPRHVSSSFPEHSCLPPGRSRRYSTAPAAFGTSGPDKTSVFVKPEQHDTDRGDIRADGKAIRCLPPRHTRAMGGRDHQG